MGRKRHKKGEFEILWIIKMKNTNHNSKLMFSAIKKFCSGIIILGLFFFFAAVILIIGTHGLTYINVLNEYLLKNKKNICKTMMPVFQKEKFENFPKTQIRKLYSNEVEIYLNEQKKGGI